MPGLFATRASLLLAVLCLLGFSPAEARKVALIIGNSTYANTTSLKNPANDAALIARSARAAGFEVTTASDLNMASFQRTLRDFRVAADGSEVAMIYYSGHGIEGQGKNWLIPVDSKLETDFDLPYEAINMDRLLEALAGAQVRMVILDACRNNPFGNAWKTGIRAVPMGLNGTEYDDVMVIFAAAPGQTATDGTGDNSPFAMSLAKRLPEPGLALQMLGGAVRDDVLAATGGKQRPFVSASITGTPIFLVNKAGAGQQVAAVAAVPETGAAGDRSAGDRASDRASLDALMWQGAVSSNTLAGYQAYLREFPAGFFSNFAKQSIAKLQGGTGVAATPPAALPVVNPPHVVVPAPAPAAALVTPSAIPASTVGSNAIAAAPMPAAVSPAPAPVPASIQTPPAALITAGPNAASAGTGTISASTDTAAPRWGRSGLPSLPATPQFSAGDYPNCREEFQAIAPTLERVDAINRCTVALDQYYGTKLTPFRNLMIEHQKKVSAMYTEQVGGQMQFSSEEQSNFYKAMMKEHADSNPDGVHFADYRATEARYKADRAYMQDRYCFMTGCNGYTAPAFVAAAPVVPATPAPAPPKR